MMIGVTLNQRYRVLRLLGSGRCGQTYLAQDIQDNKVNHCVIKQFEPEAKDTLSLRKAKYLFAREIKILRILGKSDRIPDLLSHFREAGKFYLVHEYVEGTDLSLELGERIWTESEVLNLIKEILEILEVAHRERVIHQDIKPSNIIRRASDGKLMLIDFGSVKKINNQMANSEGNTSLTVPIGTRGYMAPEQKSIKPKLESDIYGVGMIGIYALTGVEPQDIALDHGTETVQWHHLKQIKPKLREVLDCMVVPDLKRRYSSASQALKAFRDLTLDNKLFSVRNVLIAGSLLLIIPGAGYYYWRLESSLTKTNQVEIFSRDLTQVPFVYRNQEYGISMKYPDSWRLSESQPTPGTIAQFKPQVTQASLSPRVSLEVKPSNANSLKQYTANALNQITQLPQAKIIDSRPIVFAGNNGHRVTFTMVNPQKNSPQQYLQFWTLKSDRIYKITYYANTDDYRAFASSFEQEMIPSIQINP